jgi:hypothetical protein
MCNCCERPDVFTAAPKWKAHKKPLGICTSCGQIVLVNFLRRRTVPLSARAMLHLLHRRPDLYQELVDDSDYIRRRSLPMEEPYWAYQLRHLMGAKA